MHTGGVNAAYLGIGLVLVLGVAVVVYGWLGDRVITKRRQAMLSQPPDRTIPGLRPGAPSPRYVTAAEALESLGAAAPAELSVSQRTELRRRLDGAPSVAFGHATPAFVTDPPSGLCVLDRPRILVADERIESIRELLGFLESSRSADRAAVVVAPGFGDAVLGTLEVNAARRTLRCDAVLIPDAAQRRVLCSLAGAVPLPRQDLMSGYLPESSIGGCGTWVSGPTQSWLLST